MVESLDDLLQCLESDYQQGSKSTSKRIHTLHRSEPSLNVNEILSLDLNHSPVEAEPSKKSRNVPEKIKCCPTLIGGTASALKRNISPISRTCLALHCRDCDFPVSLFPDYQWTGDVEYLFLRTNMPDFGKVLRKLTKKNGSVAYACHCAYFTTETLQSLHETALPWFCRGHIYS